MWRRPRSGRSSRTPGSRRHPSGRPVPGRTSCAPRRTRSSRATSSKPSPCPGRLYVFALIEHTDRRIRILGVTAHPTTSWVVHAACNLVMDLQDAGCQARYLIRDRDVKFPGMLDTILADAGIEVV